MSTNEHRRYRFGPLERRGLIGSLRPAQVLVIAASLTVGVILMRALTAGTGVVAALVLAVLAVAFCFWPIGGRSIEEWLPVVSRHAFRRLRGRNVQLSPAPQAGAKPAADGRPEAIAALPEAARDLELLAAPLHGDTVGVIKDRRAHTYTAALAVTVTSFGLLERTEQADGDEIGRYLGEAWARDAVAVDSLSMQSYLELTNTAPAVTTDHELFVCLQIDAKRAWRQIKRAGGKDGPDAGACGVLLRELEALAERLTSPDVRVVGALRPGMLATAIRVAFDPWSRPGLARLAVADPDRDGIDEAAAWPVGTENSWTFYRTDGAFHATYWIASWPRIDVGAAFLSPLLLHAQMVRAIGVTMEAVSPLWAIREVEAARTTDIADRDLRGRMGFIETARGRRKTDAVARREEELADGHAAVRFAGYVTVSARSAEELDRNCSEIEHAAQMARLELLRLYGQQEEAFAYTLPLCRGLR